MTISELLEYRTPPTPTKFTEIELASLFENLEILYSWFYDSKDELKIGYEEIINNFHFAIVCGLTRDLEVIKKHELIDSMIAGYVEDYFTSHLYGNKDKFKNQCKSLVTGFLFQPPLIIGKNQKQRDIYSRITSLDFWHPNGFVIEFCNRLDSVFDKL